MTAPDRDHPPQHGSVPGAAHLGPDAQAPLAGELAEVADPMALLRGLFALSPVPHILFDATGHPLAANRAYAAMFGAVPPREYSVLRDEVAARVGVADAVRRAFAGETVQTPTFWYDPKELEHIVVRHANRVAIACTFFPVFGERGQVAQVAVAYKDVTAELEAKERAEAERDRLALVVAEKERLARALHESDERLRATLEAAHVGTWEWTVTDNHVAWSPNIEAIFGLAPGTFAGTYEAWLELVHPDDRPGVAGSVADALARGGSYAVEFRFLRADGLVGWQSAAGHAIHDAAGRPIALRGVVFDVTARRRAEREVEAERRRLSDVLFQAPAAIAIHRRDDLCTTLANANYERLAPFDGDAHDDRPRPPLSTELIERVFRSGAPYAAKELPAGADAAALRYFNVVCQPLRDADNAIDSVVSFAVDVTELVTARRQAESLADALRTSETRYRSFVSQSTEGIWRAELRTPIRADAAVDAQLEAMFEDGYLAECNDAMARMYGFDAAIDLAGMGIGQLLVRDDPKNVAYLRAFVESGYRLEQVESVEVDRDGARRIIQNSLVGVVEDGYLVRAWGTQRDVTELIEARRVAESANRAKDEFLAMLGHELRNPLAPMVTAIELMKLRGNKTAFQREREVLERQVRYVVRLVDDLLDVSRMIRGKVVLDRRPLEIADCVAAAIELSSALIEQQSHDLSVDVPRGLSVYGDAMRLTQVFTNVINNAAKYTPARGHIRVTAEREGAHVRVRVRDDGIGIRAEILPTIFDLFVQERQSLDRAGGGLGLGLAIVRSLVTLHDGAVEARSEGPGRGAEVIVSLPALDVDTAAEPAATPAPPAATSDGRRVLIVDDNEDASELIAFALRDLGHDVTVASDGASALAILETVRPEIGFLDIGLPVMNGYELARHIHARPGLEGLPLVAVTGYGQESDRLAARDAGFAELLVKPVAIDALAEAVSRLSPSPGFTRATLTSPRRS